jgi:hypothetical protein
VTPVGQRLAVSACRLAWEQHVLIKPIPERRVWGGAHWDFSVFDPAGRFFLRRILLDDFRCGEFYLRTKLSLDPPIQMAEVAETLRTAQRFAEALGYDGPKTSLYFQFWWSLLEGRILGSWTHPGVDFFVSSVATDNDRQSRIRMPMDASAEQLIAGVAEALKPLTHAFGGYELPNASVAFWVKQRLGIS